MHTPEPETPQSGDHELNGTPDENDAYPEGHASTGGAAAVGATAGGVIGVPAGPIGVAAGAVAGAVIGATVERLMHVDEALERVANTDEPPGWVAPSVAESADPTPVLAITATDPNHEHQFVDGACTCGAAL